MNSDASHPNTARNAGLNGVRLTRGLNRLEAFLTCGLLLGWIAALLLARSKGVQLDGFGFTASFFSTTFLLGLGIITRRRHDERTALLCIYTGLFLAIVTLSTLLTYLRMPLSAPTLDAWFVEIDAYLGYHWPSFLALVESAPALSIALAWNYHVALLQVVAVIILLAWSVDTERLQGFVLTGVISLVATTAFWWVWPSFGAVYHFAGGAVETETRVLDNGFALEMARLAEAAPASLRLSELTGIVAFPSYHTVMACLVGWFGWHTRFRAILAPLALLMFPATLSHGGHHLIDILAGIAVFAASLWVARRVLGQSPNTRRA